MQQDPSRPTRLRGVAAALVLGVALGLSPVVAARLARRAARAGGLALAPDPWPMFHHDAQHTGVADGRGRIDPDLAPLVRWRYPVYVSASVPITNIRWTSTLPLGDLDGDGTLEIVVTTPNGTAEANRVIVLKDTPGGAEPYEVMWVYTETTSALDSYSPVLADADHDGVLDVIISPNEGPVRALRGTDGQPLWEYETGRRTEAGPTVADLDGDGALEVILPTDCFSGIACPGVNDQALLIVLPLTATNPVTPSWVVSYPSKLDSAVPVIADIAPADGANRQAVIAGTWAGELLVAWRNPAGTVITDTFDLRTLDITATVGVTPAIRSSPLVWDFGEGPTLVFGWVPNEDNPGVGRISALRVSADMTAGTHVNFTPLWTEPYDAWKSSVTLLPVSDPPLIVAGYGLAAPPFSQSGVVGGCEPGYVFGGIVALHADGSNAWQHDYGNAEGNPRASAAVADIDGDGALEVVFPVGCYGKLHIYDGATGAEEWTLQLGPRSQGSPSIGDLDGDGRVEVVLSSYDGNVWVLGGAHFIHLPQIAR